MPSGQPGGTGQRSQELEARSAPFFFPVSLRLARGQLWKSTPWPSCNQNMPTFGPEPQPSGCILGAPSCDVVPLTSVGLRQLDHSELTCREAGSPVHGTEPVLAGRMSQVHQWPVDRNLLWRSPGAVPGVHGGHGATEAGSRHSGPKWETFIVCVCVRQREGWEERGGCRGIRRELGKTTGDTGACCSCSQAGTFASKFLFPPPSLPLPFLPFANPSAAPTPHMLALLLRTARAVLQEAQGTRAPERPSPRSPCGLGRA